MKKAKMGFFKVSMHKLRTIAYETKNPDLLAGFIVMARHGTSNIVANREPYTFTGAGANVIKEKFGVGEAKAKGILDKLLQYNFIKPISKNIKIPFQNKKEARYELLQNDLDLDLPHSFTDGLGSIADAPIKRIKKVHNYRNLTDISEDELRLDALILLLEIYVATNMSQYGGINPSFLFRKWEVHRHREKNGNIEWLATPVHQITTKNIVESTYLYLSTESEEESIQTLNYPENITLRFWNAIQNLENMGLIYEAVTILDTVPSNPFAKAICTIRVNDYHANTRDSADPNLLTFDEGGGFYIQEKNDQGDEEQIRFRFLSKDGFLIGIYRPRFRAANQDAGIWFEKEKQACTFITNKLKEQEELF